MRLSCGSSQPERCASGCERRQPCIRWPALASAQAGAWLLQILSGWQKKTPRFNPDPVTGEERIDYRTFLRNAQSGDLLLFRGFGAAHPDRRTCELTQP